MCTILFPIAFRPLPVACIPNVRSFCGGDGGDGSGGLSTGPYSHNCLLLGKNKPPRIYASCMVTF